MQRPWGQERVIEELGMKKAQDWNLEKRYGGSEVGPVPWHSKGGTLDIADNTGQDHRTLIFNLSNKIHPIETKVTFFKS